MRKVYKKSEYIETQDEIENKEHIAVDNQGDTVKVVYDFQRTKDFIVNVNGIIKRFKYKSLEWHLISGYPKETGRYVFNNFDSHN